jgi:hypothetical protein
LRVGTYVFWLCRGSSSHPQTNKHKNKEQTLINKSKLRIAKTLLRASAIAIPCNAHRAGHGCRSRVTPTPLHPRLHPAGLISDKLQASTVILKRQCNGEQQAGTKLRLDQATVTTTAFQARQHPTCSRPGLVGLDSKR